MSESRADRAQTRRNLDRELHGHANVRADVCFNCKGKLKGPDGSHCETLYDDGVVAFAAAICRACKDQEVLQRPRTR